MEVKGERDRLSDQQRLWLLALHESGVGVCVCHVTERMNTEII